MKTKKVSKEKVVSIRFKMQDYINLLQESFNEDKSLSKYLEDSILIDLVKLKSSLNSLKTENKELKKELSSKPKEIIKEVLKIDKNSEKAKNHLDKINSFKTLKEIKKYLQNNGMGTKLKNW